MSGPTKYNARDQIFQIQNPSDASWVAIAPLGLNTFSLDQDGKDTDTTTFGSQGAEESQVMSRSKTMKLEGFHLKDPASGALDPGQQLVETLAEQVGDASVGGFRFAAPGDTVYRVWQVTAKMSTIGGGNDDKSAWGVTLTRTGPSTTAARP